MEKAYKRLGVILLFTLLPLTIIGFMKTYLGQFPNFEKHIGWNVHFHFAISAIWILLLIIQPIFIKKKKVRLHQFFGNTSYFLFLLLLISFIPLFRKQFDYNFMPLIILTASDIIGVILFYFLGIYHRKNVEKHMRYMIVLSIMFAMPAVGRIFSHWFKFSFMGNMNAGLLIELLILLGLITMDKKNERNYIPYVVGLVFFLVRHGVLYLV